LILGFGVGLGVWDGGFRFVNRGFEVGVWKNYISVPFFPTFPFVPLLPVPLLPVPFLPKTIYSSNYT